VSLLTAIDHLRISVVDIDEATEQYQRLLGCADCWRGEIDGAAAAVLPAGNLHIWLREGPSDAGLDAVCFRVADMQRLSRRLQRLGLASGDAPGSDPLASAALAPPGAAVLTTDPAATRGLRLIFVERPAAPRYAAAEILGLDHIVIDTGDAHGTAFLLAAQLGLDLRMDLSRPDWGARLLFFRCGDLIVEVAQRSGREDAAAGDRFYGLSWRVTDAEAARAGLSAAGVDVSPVRQGRKAGTFVFTVRDGAAEVPTLMLQPP
jgi:hypothetical protein